MLLPEKLCKASAQGNLSEVLFLLNEGAEINGFNRCNRTPLQVGTNYCLYVFNTFERVMCCSVVVIHL